MKKIRLLLVLIASLAYSGLSAQVGINTDGTAPAASAMLDVQDTTKGVLLPRLTNAQRDAIASPAAGLIIYNTQAETLQYYNGNSWVLITEGNCGTPFYDVVNNRYYHTIMLGTQCWMTQNLASTKYNDDANIPMVENNATWATLSTPAYCWYVNDSTTYAEIYGALYNWYTVNTGKLCPTGWHVPADAEWTTLENFLKNNGFSCNGYIPGYKIAKSLVSGFNWISSGITEAAGSIGLSAYRNKSGFRALPGASRGSINGSYSSIGYNGYWWSATEFSTPSTSAWLRNINFQDIYVNGYGSNKKGGLSVRCLRD